MSYWNNDTWADCRRSIQLWPAHRVFKAHYFYCIIFLPFCLHCQKDGWSRIGSLLPGNSQYIHFFNVTHLVLSFISWRFDFPGDSPCFCPSDKICFLMTLKPSISPHSHDQFHPRLNMRATSRSLLECYVYECLNCGLSWRVPEIHSDIYSFTHSFNTCLLNILWQ